MLTKVIGLTQGHSVIQCCSHKKSHDIVDLFHNIMGLSHDIVNLSHDTVDSSHMIVDSFSISLCISVIPSLVILYHCGFVP